jgi:tRNA pseudouridine38-40 synthase
LNRYKFVISYKGSGYCGSQIQKNGKTVEGEIKKVLRSIFKDDIVVSMSGRTDAGVHATGQVVSFKAVKQIPEQNIRMAMNSLLPGDIRVKKLYSVDIDFDPRRLAKSRVYNYLFTNEDILSYLDDYVAKINFTPDLKQVLKIKDVLIGCHDFVHLRSCGSNENNTIREIMDFDIRVEKVVDVYSGEVSIIYKVVICANSFLYKMVRHIVGAVFEVLKGKQLVEEFASFLTENEKKYRYKVADAKGLSLIKVNY